MRRLFGMQWSTALQYRSDALLWMAAEALIPIVAMAIWYTVAQEGTRGVSPQDVVTYYVVIIFVKLATDAWNGAFLARDILDGTVVKDLIRPLPVFWNHVAANLSEKALKLFIPLMLFAGVLLLAPTTFSPALYEPRHMFLFSVSLFLAMVLAFSVEHVIGMIAFWLEDVHQIRRYKVMLESIATGILIPFAFMSELAVRIFSFLPFRYIISAPAEILTGQTVGLAASGLLMVQGVWVVASIGLALFVWHRGLARYAIPGQ